MILKLSSIQDTEQLNKKMGLLNQWRELLEIINPLHSFNINRIK